MATTKKISLKEVEKHSSKKDVWIVLHNDVLDVTSFLADHPGGEKVIMDVAGKDASLAFEDAGHSHDAREIAAQYKIGWLPPHERRRFVDSSNSVVSHRSSRSIISRRSRHAKPHNLSPKRLPPYQKPRRKKSNKKEPDTGGPKPWQIAALIAIAVAIIAGVTYHKLSQ